MVNFNNISIDNSCDLAQIQLDICNKWENNVIYPLYLAIAFILIRWIILYKLSDKFKSKRLFEIYEMTLDMLAMICISISIVWMMVA